MTRNQETIYYRVPTKEATAKMLGKKVIQAYTFDDGTVKNSFVIFSGGLAYTNMETNERAAPRWWSTDVPTIKTESPVNRSGLEDEEDEPDPYLNQNIELAKQVLEEQYSGPPVEGAPPGISPEAVEALRKMNPNKITRSRRA